VPPQLQIRRQYHWSIRHWDSSDYLAILPAGPRSVIVIYDVQNYIEHWNAKPVSGARMVRIQLE